MAMIAEGGTAGLSMTRLLNFGQTVCHFLWRMCSTS